MKPQTKNICECGHHKEWHNKKFCKWVPCPCKKFRPQTRQKNSAEKVVSPLAEIIPLTERDWANIGRIQNGLDILPENNHSQEIAGGKSSFPDILRGIFDEAERYYNER